MAVFDLESTYLSLDGQGRVARHPVEGFWATIGENPALLGNLVGAYTSSADWPHWEMHPQGDEILVMIEGTMTLVLDEPGGERRVEMAPGTTCVVPAGVWHRGLAGKPGRYLGITHGAGTQHRPL